MPNTKEKLVELISSVQYLGGLEEKLADYLINNGVTFATDNNVGSKWISVKDRLPETTIRCIVSKHNVPFLAYFDGEKWRETNKLMVVDGVTHWMPMPPAPEDVK